jgi:hypothetical protein
MNLNPGSDAAIKKGCTCPVLDNGRGNEELGRIRGFWIDQDCPIHGKSAKLPAKKAKKSR